MQKRGMLSDEDSAKFQAVKRDPAAAEKFLLEHRAKYKRDIDEHAKLAPRQNSSGGLLGILPLGGGLRKIRRSIDLCKYLLQSTVNGVLQPLSGVLENVDIPTPQSQGLVEIPGDDPDHQFQAPGPTDVRGICPTLNALANHGKCSSLSGSASGVPFTYGLSVFLSALGLLAGGDLPTGKYTIGGADSRVPNTIGPALGLDSHGVFEIDGSITRQDVHFGNNANFLLQRWEEYVDAANDNGGLFNEAANAQDNGFRYDNSRNTNPDFFAGAAWFAVSHAERVFVYQGLPNGTNQSYADYQNVAPFFLDERFPEEWYRRADPFTLPSAFMEAAGMFLLNPRELGANEGLNNFVPLGVDLTSQTPAQIGCFIIENILDLAPDQFKPAIANNFDTYQAFVQGIILPFFENDGFFNCDVQSFARPSANAGVADGSVSSSGSPVNGSYPGVLSLNFVRSE
ncbi:MAG: hypothetical protein Q9162_005374 [Coniocarpon cinnabarinum]